jgi:hypothetical protein
MSQKLAETGGDSILKIVVVVAWLNGNDHIQ